MVQKSLSKKIGFGMVLVCFCLAGQAFLAAQATTGIISGVARDESGALVPGVTITVKNAGTGIVRTGITGDSGGYRIPALVIGTYDVEAELAGFKKGLRNGVTLNVGQEVPVDFTLQVGDTTQEVTVTDSLSLVEISTATVSSVVTQRQIREIPLNSRSFLELIPLQTGAVFQEAGTADGRLVTKGFAKKLAVVGTRAASNSFLLDGADVNDASNTGGSSAGGSMAGVEAVAEFRVVTNAYDAEYGKHTGAVVSAVTKSGTNDFHGSLFEFLRNDNLDARNFFDREQSGGKPEFRRNQFGFSLGGPIIKNRTFFFGNYEGMREARGVTTSFNVPGMQARNGIVQGAAVPVNSKVLPYLAIYPLPNQPDRADGTAQYIGERVDRTNQNYFTSKIDHRFSDSDSVFGRFTFENSQQLLPRLSSAGDNRTRSRLLALEHTHLFSAMLLARTHFSFNRTRPSNFDIPLPGFAFPDFSFKDTRAQGTISVTGLDSIGGDTRNPNLLTQNNFDYKEDIVYNRGKHSMKLGAQWERLQFNLFSGFQAGGSFAFGSLPEFLRADPSSFSVTKPGSDNVRGIRQSLFGFYFQDDIKVTSTFSFNMGLRYEFITVPTEVNGKISVIRDLSLSRLQTVRPDTMDVGGSFIQNPSLKNFAPRIGITWDPFGAGKTAIRAGGGVYDDQVLPYLYWFELANAPPFRSGSSLLRQNTTIDFPNAYTTQRAALISGLGGSLTQVDGKQYDLKQPTVYKWSLDIQQQVGANTTLDVGYSGTRGVHLFRQVQFNTTPSEIRNGRRYYLIDQAPPNPYMSRMRWSIFDAESDYHGLRLGVTRQFSRGLQFQSSFTFSKSIDDWSTWVRATDLTSSNRGGYGTEKAHGLSGFDVRRVFYTNFVYDLPGAKWNGTAGKLIGGWTMSGILRLQDGHPITLGAEQPRQGNLQLQQVEGGSLDLAPGVDQKKIIRPRNPNQYYDPSAFLYPTPFFEGNLGKNTVTVPGIVTFDTTLTKNIALGESRNLQFRTEFYNLFNRANFGIPNITVYDRNGRVRSDVGQITSTTTSARQIQLALRFLF
ncbi:MAG TPA: TonB-dependent receptor [Terriglobia bacterium]|nr:TonB-dependent receptor [Terriglobia bacterium]